MMDIVISQPITIFIVFLGLLSVVLFLPVGISILKIFGLNNSDTSFTEFWVVPFASIVLGAICIAMLVYTLLSFGMIGRGSLYLIFIAQLFLLLMLRKEVFTCILFAVKDHFKDQSSLLSKIPTVITLLILLVFLFNGVTRATIPTLEGDSANTYLNVPNLYLQYKEIIPIGNFVGDMAKNGFLLSAYGLGLHSSMLAHVIWVLLSFVGMIFCFFFLARISTPTIASIIVILFTISDYQITEVMLEAKFDGFTFTCALTSFIALWLLTVGKRDKWIFVLLGLSSGFLAGISYNNILPAVILVLSGLFIIISTGEIKKNLHTIVIICISFVIVSLPTYFENIRLFGNPIYPFAANVFNSGLGVNIPDDTFAFAYINNIKNDFSVKTVISFFMLPFSLINAEEAMRLLKVKKDFGFLIIWSLAFVAILFLVFKLFQRKRVEFFSFEYIVLVGFVILYTFWALNQHILRYFAPSFPFLFVLSVFGLKYIESFLQKIMPKATQYGVVSIYAYLIFLVYTIWFPWIFRHGYNPYKEITQKGSTVSEYVRDKHSYGGHSFGRAMYELRLHTKPGDKILSFIVGSFYYGTDVKTFSGNGGLTIPSTLGIPKPLSRYNNGKEFSNDLVIQGFKWVVYSPTYTYFSLKEKPTINSFLKNRKPFLTVGDVLIYKL